MKITILHTWTLVLALFLANVQLIAQRYAPILDNTSWIVNVQDFRWNYNFEITAQGDTTIAGVPYKRFNDGLEPQLIREDSVQRRVYKFKNGAERLLFDFSVHLSDTLDANGILYVVTEEDSVVTSAGKRKKLSLVAINSWFREEWIEGVGSRMLPIYANNELFTDPSYWLICSSGPNQEIFNGGLYYSNTATDCNSIVLGVSEQIEAAQASAFPNPFTQSSTIKLDKELQNATWSLTDMQGKRILSQQVVQGNQITLHRNGLSSGLYFVKVIDEGNMPICLKVMITD